MQQSALKHFQRVKARELQANRGVTRKNAPTDPAHVGRWRLGAPGEVMKSIIKDLAQLSIYHKWINNVKNSQISVPFTRSSKSLTIFINRFQLLLSNLTPPALEARGEFLRNLLPDRFINAVYYLASGQTWKGAQVSVADSTSSVHLLQVKSGNQAGRIKMTATYQIRQCQRWGCNLRFPDVGEHAQGRACPKCGDATTLVHAPYRAHQVEVGKISANGPEVVALLDNIRSVFNVGNMLRTADGAGIRQMYLCGITPTPNNPKLAKSALGAERQVDWTYHEDGLAASISLRQKGLRLWALEGGPRSESLFEATADFTDPPVVLVVGSEVSGVDPAIIEQCERVVCLPMQGVKTTLNVAVAFGIAVYFLRFGLPSRLLKKSPDSSF